MIFFVAPKPSSLVSTWMFAFFFYGIKSENYFKKIYCKKIFVYILGYSLSRIFFWDLNPNPWWPLAFSFFFHGIELPNIINDFIIV
jgi:hypothetical protein